MYRVSVVLKRTMIDDAFFVKPSCKTGRGWETAQAADRAQRRWMVSASLLTRSPAATAPSRWAKPASQPRSSPAARAPSRWEKSVSSMPTPRLAGRIKIATNTWVLTHVKIAPASAKVRTFAPTARDLTQQNAPLRQSRQLASEQDHLQPDPKAAHTLNFLISS